MTDNFEVLHCYRTFYPESQGGLEHSILEISANVPSSRVLTLSNIPGRYSLLDGSILVEATRRWFSLASCCIGGDFLRALKRDAAEIIHFHFPWPFGDLSYLMAGSGRPLVVTYHSDIVRQRFLGCMYRPLMHLFLARADRIVATSQNYLESSNVLQKFRHKVEVIPLGISECNYPIISKKTLAAVESRFGKDFMLFVGVLRYYKGLDFLIRAAVGQPYRLVIAGKGPDLLRLKKLSRDLGASNVIFAGYISDSEKMALLNLCRSVVFPSHLRSEAFGVTLIEGLMCSKPLISCEIGTGTSYVNKNGETGLVVKPADIAELRKAMSYLWENANVAIEMGKAGRLRFEEFFTSKIMAKSYLDLYQRVLSERAAT
ncbi:D-inositol-3-phosphate glycosyltransferase [Microbulbifer aestuariivivens]|uniref:D-inositol-3-phosphate glycosyltransferase n=1 Tax=Microbulbifer aestuariivivens TaxID=1908308 RepID=A0ABP9WJR4_9GAMM